MRWSASFTIRQVALAVVAGFLVLASLIGWYAAYQTRAVTHNLEQHSLKAASAEISAAVQRLSSLIEEQGSNLAEWDETRQQILTPEYYAYWQSERLYVSGMISEPHSTAALYNRSGTLLAPAVDTSGSPRELPAGYHPFQTNDWLVNESGTIVLYHLFPVFNDTQRQMLIGYGLVRTDFMQALRKQGQFYFADQDSISVPLQPGETIGISRLFTRLKYGVRSNPDQQRFQSILTQTMLALFLLLLVMVLLGSFIYSRLLVRPMRRLSDDINAMQQGRFMPGPLRQESMRIKELEHIRRSLHDYQLQLRELHGSLELQNQEFHSQARHDALTGCHNRRAYEEDWEKFQQDTQASPQGVAFLLFDCDRFKTINDTYGHAKGDRVLTIVADQLLLALRANDRLYRIGGDEFATFMSYTTTFQAKQIAQRCQSLIDASSFTDLGIKEPVSISIGIAFCAADHVDRIGDLPKQADIAMYTAKQPGRKPVAVYGEDTDRSAQTLVASRETSALFQALATPGMIEMHYQPIHALPGRQVDYYEALARIRHAGEIIMPGAFLPVVSSRRLEADFDLAVLQQIDADLSSGLFPPGRGVSINLSAQSISRPDILSQLMELSRHSTRHRLTLEITETSLITQMMEVKKHLEMLQSEHHFCIAMDDFGTGYSPLRYLVDLPVDVIKFDISLVSTLDEGDRASQVVADFARMMSDVGYELVAEGVETESVLQKVESLGFAHVQGYLLGRPTPLAQLGAQTAQATGSADPG